MSALQQFSRITPFLWFDSNAEEAVNFYLTVFKNSRRLDTMRSPDDAAAGPKGDVLTIAFELDGQKFTALNEDALLKFNESVSFLVPATHRKKSIIIGRNSRATAQKVNTAGPRISSGSPGKSCRACPISSTVRKRCRPCSR